MSANKGLVSLILENERKYPTLRKQAEKYPIVKKIFLFLICINYIIGAFIFAYLFYNWMKEKHNDKFLISVTFFFGLLGFLSYYYEI